MLMKLQLCQEHKVDNMLTRMNIAVPYSYSIFHSVVLFKQQEDVHSLDGFLEFCKGNMNSEECVALQRVDQSDEESSQWMIARYGRITASKMYEVSLCNTLEGSLVETILGGTPCINTTAMRRGKALEVQLVKAVEKFRTFTIQKCGILLSSDFPIFGASTGGIFIEECVGVKCSAKQSFIKSYIIDNKITVKQFSQM